MFEKVKENLKEGKTLMAFGSVRVIAQALGVLVPLIVAGLFDNESFGSFVLCRFWIFLFAAFTISANQTPFLVSAGQEFESENSINKAFWVHCLYGVFSIALFALAVIFAGNMLGAFAGTTQRVLFSALLSYVGFVILLIVTDTMLALGFRVQSGLYSAFYHVLCIALLAFLYYFHEINLETVLLSFFIAAIPLLLLFIFIVDTSKLLPIKFEWIYIKSNLYRTKWFIIGVLSAFLVNWGDNLYLRPFVSLAAIGTYGFAYQCFKGLIFLTVSLNHYFLVFLSRNIGKPEKIYSYLYNKRPKIMLLGIAALVAMFFLYPPVVRLFYSDKWIASELIFRVLLIANAINLYLVFYNSLFEANLLYRFTNISGLLQVLLNLGLGALLVWQFGVIGAAVATVIAVAIRVALYEIYFHSKLKGQLGLTKDIKHMQ